MRRYYLFYWIFISLFACQNKVEEKQNNVDSTVSLSKNVVSDTSMIEARSPSVPSSDSTAATPSVTQNLHNVNLPKVDTTGKAARDRAMKKADIQIRTFPNTENGGYGYDVILDGHTYVHQPNIPALPGNKGFDTEENAKKVAKLVSFKIRNNIMPPSVDVKELDSLGIR